MSASRILVGVVGRPHGIHGLVRVTSYTADPAALQDYAPLLDEQGRRWKLVWHAEVQDGAGIAELRDEAGTKLADRAAAEKLTNLKLYVERSVLPAPDDEEYYLADLVGLEVRLAGGTVIGRVRQVHDYGAGASLEIETTMGAFEMVPFTRAAVPVVDLAARMLEVAPPDEFTIDQDLGPS